MNTDQLRKLSVRAVLAWLALSILGLWFDKAIVSLLIPALTMATGLLSDDYRPLLELAQHNGKDMILMTATTVTPLGFGSEITIPAGTRLNSGSNIIHTLVPIVILYTALIAAPAKNLWHRLLLLLLGIPATLVTSALTTPFVLFGHIEIFFQQIAAKADLVRAEPLPLKWMLFVEGGGRWLIPLVLAVLCVVIAETTVAARRQTSNSGH